MSVRELCTKSELNLHYRNVARNNIYVDKPHHDILLENKHCSSSDFVFDLIFFKYININEKIRAMGNVINKH